MHGFSYLVLKLKKCQCRITCIDKLTSLGGQETPNKTKYH